MTVAVAERITGVWRAMQVVLLGKKSGVKGRWRFCRFRRGIRGLRLGTAGSVGDVVMRRVISSPITAECNRATLGETLEAAVGAVICSVVGRELPSGTSGKKVEIAGSIVAVVV